MITYTVTEYEESDYNDFRDNLTISRTINILDDISRGWIGDYNYDGTESDFELYKLHMALYKAINILTDVASKEKQ